MLLRHISSLSAILLFAFHSFAQTSSSYSSASVFQEIRRLSNTGNALYIAAHPDDENTRLISYLSNHLAITTTYLSLTRGDGGQNLIGPEFREKLGIIRTHELMEARKIDGGQQLFSRANDFGFSKTPAETFNIWNRNEVLADVVWAIRKTKPDVIINRFSTDTSRPNHGHHTASAILSEEAIKMAADPNAFPEQLKYVETWQAKRLYFNTSTFFYGSKEAFDKADKTGMLTVDIGAYNEISGESNSEIAGRSRSMHKSQGFGSAETRGINLEYLKLIFDSGNETPTSLFEGIDLTWNRVPGGKTIQSLVQKLEKEYDFKNPSGSIHNIMSIKTELGKLPPSFYKVQKEKITDVLIQHVLGLYLAANTKVFRAIPGSDIDVDLEFINRSDAPVKLLSVSNDKGEKLITVDSTLSFNTTYSSKVTIHVPDNLSIPYWLKENATDGMYSVSDQRLRGAPADPAPIQLTVGLKLNDQLLSYTIPVQYRTVDPAVGELYRPVSIVPPVSVESKDEVFVFQNGVSRILQYTITSLKDDASGSIKFNCPDKDWSITPPEFSFDFKKSGETKKIEISVTPSSYSESTKLIPTVTIDNHEYHHKVSTIDYTHLPYMSVVSDASTPLQSFEIKITDRRIGYLPGAGDNVPQSLKQIGYNPVVLTYEELSSEVLNQYDVIILGVRAFNTKDELAYQNQLLYNWVENGGTLIVQYNTNGRLVTDQIAPYKLSLSRTRVSEENADVKILQPESPVFNYPNKITIEDFRNWTQERGLYFASEWDTAFTPLLEMNDTNEPPAQGSLLVAQHGKGYYVYSGLSWFRHLPAGNAGAYRLISNIISLGYTKSKS